MESRIAAHLQLVSRLPLGTLRVLYLWKADLFGRKWGYDGNDPGYGRARRGERVREGTPAGHWKTLSILSAIGTVGLVATMIIEAPTDGEVFLCYLEQVLGPQLTPGQT